VRVWGMGALECKAQCSLFIDCHCLGVVLGEFSFFLSFFLLSVNDVSLFIYENSSE
jgi:hypothetical protein